MQLSQQSHNLSQLERHRIDDSTTQFSKTNKLGVTNQKEPTETELCKIILMMEESMPNRSIEKIVRMLYSYQIKRQPLEKIFCDYVPPMSHIPQAHKGYKYHPNNREQIIMTYPKDQYLKTSFNTQAQHARYKQKRQIAKSFVSKGYSAEIAQNFLRRANFNCIISKENYKLIMSSIICQTFRKMQQFLIGTCNIKIKGLNKQEMSSAITFIIKDNPNNEYLYVFKKFIRLYFSLSQTTIAEVQTAHCYLEIIKFIHNKRITVEGLEQYYTSQNLFDQRSQSVSATDTLEQEDQLKKTTSTVTEPKNNLIELYDDIVDEKITKAFHQTRSLQGTVQILRRIYPTWATFDKVKNKLLILTKTALYKVQQQAQTLPKNFPKLHKLSSEQIAIILSHNQGQNIRCSLFDYCGKNALNEDQLFFLVEMINDFIDTVKAEPSKQLLDETLIGIGQ